MGRFGFLFCLALAACTSYPAPPAVEATPNQAPQELVAKTAALVDGDLNVYCSGVWVDAQRILTAAHCNADLEVGDPVAYAVRADMLPYGEDGLKRSHMGVLSARDEDHDLALVVTLGAAPAHDIARVGDDPYAGERVQTMGHPLGLWWSYSRGDVAAVRKIEGMIGWWIQTTAPVSPGNSGGGLFDEGGRLLGICHGYFPRGQNLNLYVHTNYLRSFLAQHGS